VHVIGTTARDRRWRDNLSLRGCAARALEHAAGGRVAIVFGPEDMGLSNDELELCNAVVTIPTAPGASSLNLAHAVLLMGYELFSACGAATDAAPVLEPAPLAMTEAMFDHMRSALLEIGYLNPQNPDHSLGMIRRLLTRAGLSIAETSLLRGMFRQLVWYSKHRKK
jgi:tRNA/rRNA methyltransferase